MNLSSLKIKKQLKTKPTFGGWITIGHPAIAEIMAQAGFDWLVIDLFVFWFFAIFCFC
jgi:2-dehydro-3-deoxyglucarate aldolase